MELYLTTTMDQYFSSPEREQFIDDVLQKVPAFIQNNYFRIKPIKEIKDKHYKYYELKLHTNNQDYRLAFAQENQQVIICYLSSELQKHLFDKEMYKWWKKHKDSLGEIVQIKK